MSRSHLDRLEARGRRYGAVARWAGAFAGYLLGLSPLFALPPAADHATFRSVEINPSLDYYWQQVGIQVVDLDRRSFGLVPGWLVEVLPWAVFTVCALAAVVFIIRRRLWPVVALALACDLSLETASATRDTLALMTLQPTELTPAARAWAEADAYGRTTDMDRRLVGHGGTYSVINGVVYGGSFNHDQVRAELHYELAQAAYLRGDAATALRHYEAVRRDDLPYRQVADWRLSVMREWLQTTDHKPSPGAYPPRTAPPAGERAISTITLVAGSALALLALPAGVLGALIRRRRPRLAQLVLQL